MSMEQDPALTPLTADQEQIARDLLEVCGLEDVRAETITMAGISGTVEYGLGRCAHHFANLTPEELAESVRQKIADQQQGN